MKNLILFLVFLTGIETYAQILEPVQWSTSVEKISDNEYDLVMMANIDPSWHLYSQSVPDKGPFATVFTFSGNTNYLKKGNTKEDTGQAVDDPIFNMKIKYFEHKAIFRQRIQLIGARDFEIYGSVEYMACDDSRCLPPTLEDLRFTIIQAVQK